MEKSLDPVTWYGQRELEFTPNHFVVVRTPLTTESKLWIINNLRGRFSTIQNHLDEFHSLLVYDLNKFPAFEDPKEAVLFELTWS